MQEESVREQEVKDKEPRKKEIETKARSGGEGGGRGDRDGEYMYIQG